MIHEDEATQREKKISRNLAIGIHVLIIVLFIFGVSWHRRQSEPGAVADLWSSMSPPKQEAPRQEAPKEPPLKMTPRIEKEPPPPPPPKPEVKAVPKPDIALKEKAEKERKLKEQQELEKKKELERRKDDDAKKQKAQQTAELKKKEDEKRKAAEQQDLERKKEDEARRQAAERDNASKAAAAAQSRVYDKYIGLIQARIRSNIVEPPNLPGNPQVEFDVVLIPGGEVLNVRMTKSSGVPAYDQAVERAIAKASPLPVPSEGFSQFRELHLKFRPKE